MCLLTIKGKICSCFIEKGQKPIIFEFAAFLAASSSSLFSSRPEFRPEKTFFFQAEDGIRDAQESRGLGDVYKRQAKPPAAAFKNLPIAKKAKFKIKKLPSFKIPSCTFVP